jgi:hypothetical protein
MILLLENYTLIHGMVNYQKDSRVILYHPKTLEQLKEWHRISSPRVIDLLTNKAANINPSELNDFSKIGVLL